MPVYAEPGSVHSCLSLVPTEMSSYPARPGQERQAVSRMPGHAPPSPSPIRTVLGPRAGCPALPAPRAHTPCPRSLVPQACACRPFALHSQQLCSSPGIRSVGAWLSQTFLVVQGYPLPSSGGGCNCCLLPGHADQLPLSWQREVKPGWILTVPGGPPTGERCALAALAAMAVGRQQRCPPTELCLLAPEAGITLGHCGHHLPTLLRASPVLGSGRRDQQA